MVNRCVINLLRKVDVDAFQRVNAVTNYQFQNKTAVKWNRNSVKLTYARFYPVYNVACFTHLQRLTVFKEPTSSSAAALSPAAEKRNLIIKRAACEFKNGMYANLGIGMPMLASNYIPEGMSITLQSENGVLGLVSFWFFVTTEY